MQDLNFLIVNVHDAGIFFDGLVERFIDTFQKYFDLAMWSATRSADVAVVVCVIIPVKYPLIFKPCFSKKVLRLWLC